MTRIKKLILESLVIKGQEKVDEHLVDFLEKKCALKIPSENRFFH